MKRSATRPAVRGKTAFVSLSDCDGISLDSLASLYLAGVRRVLVEPVQHDENPIADKVRQLNRLLGSRGLRPLALKQAEPQQLRAWQREIENETADDGGRRAFLTRLAQPVADTLADEDPVADPLALLQASQAARPGALFAHVPVIEPGLCTGCDACVTVCPKEALILLKDDHGESRYDCQAQQCDGCGLCIAVCDAGAIQVAEMVEQPGEIVLDAFKCQDCGVDVHEPRGQASGDRLCRICRETGHKKKLFQVLT